MATYLTAEAIRALREHKHLTQRQLAERLGVTDKAVSKWETGKGLPDIALVEPLARELEVSVAELLAGACVINANRAANMLKARFYVCPVCGNVIHAASEGSFSCCGVLLPALEAEDPDDAHRLTIEQADHDFYVTMDHPMEKGHYASFIAYVTTDRVHLRKLYPQQAAEARFPVMGRARSTRSATATACSPRRCARVRARCGSWSEPRAREKRRKTPRTRSARPHTLPRRGKAAVTARRAPPAPPRRCRSAGSRRRW